MSLNGLDVAPVQEAYTQCQHEAGGWFLLKYVSRDQVELHGRGKNGVHEARNAIANYAESSPLYGLIIYRRRKVLIKYIPEGTSRLLQARTAVHFQDVLERYSPYETLLEITTPDELNDTTLAASFPLHTASPALSSNKLQEISEDAEDTGATPRSPSTSDSTAASIFGTQRYKMEKRVDQIMRSDRPERPLERTGRFSPSIYSPKDRVPPSFAGPDSPQKTSVSQFLIREDAGKRSVTALTPPSSSPISAQAPTLPALATESDSASVAETASPNPTSADNLPSEPTEISPAMQSSTNSRPDTSMAATDDTKDTEITRGSTDEPVSTPTSKVAESSTDQEEKKDETTESTRTDITPGPKADDPYDFSYLYKPKVKLGPRVVTTTKRAAAAASLPPSYKAAARKSDASPPQSGQTRPSNPPRQPIAIPTPPPIPVMPEYTPRPISRGSVKSIPSHRSSASTADKSRLLKALELRKRKMQRANAQDIISEPVPEETEHAPQPTPEPIREVPTPTPSEEAREEKQAVSSGINKADSGISLQGGNGEKRSEQRLSDVRVESAIPEETPVSSLNTDPPLISQEEPVQKDDVPEPTTTHTVEKEVPPIDATSVTNLVKSEPEPSDQRPQSAVSAISGGQRLSISHSEVSELSDAGEEFATPDSVAKDPIDQADIIASLQRAASDSPRDLPPIVPYSKSTPPSSRRQAETNVVPDSQGLEREPTMSLEMLDEISIAFMPPSSSDYNYKQENVGLGIRASSNAAVPAIKVPKGRQSASLADEEESASVSPAWTPLRQEAGSQRRRPGHIPAINTDDGNTTTDSEDDEFMDELEMATLHEAGSVTMSPIESAMRKESMSSLHSAHSIVRPVNIRRVSSLQQETPPVSPADGGLARNPSYTRSLTPRAIEVYEPSGIARTGNVSLGISKRIDTLEEVTTKGTGPSYQAAITDALQKSASRSGSVSPVNGQSRNARSPSPNPVSGAGSMSVSARIVKPETPDVQQNGSLQQSELILNIKQAQKNAVNPVPEDQPMPSPTYTNGTPSHAPRQSLSSVAGSEDSAGRAEGRASRLFKRMSNWSVGSKRRSAAVPASPANSTADAFTIMADRSTVSRDGSEHPPAIMVGDLNVQFPDSLLWKRRIVEIDDAGYLVFSAPGNSNGQRSGIPKKYHLRDFKIPYTPDLERQELPCSLVLDFLDGTPPIQAACEDSFSQRQVLFILRTHWKGYAAI